MALSTVFILVVIAHSVWGKECVSDHRSQSYIWEDQLKKDLIRCVFKLSYNETRTVLVSLVMKYFSVDEEAGTFSVHAWVFLRWREPGLRWKPRDYGGVRETELQGYETWLFHVMQVISAADEPILSPCSITADGEIRCAVWTVMRSFCEMRHGRWPYDSQNCSVQFGPARTGRPAVVVRPAPGRAVSMLAAAYGSQWTIVDYGLRENLTRDVHVQLDFVLEREMPGLAVVDVEPALMLSALTVAGLFLRVEGGPRLGLAGFSLLGHLVFLRQLAEDLPRYDREVPTVLLYSRGSLTLTVVLVFVTFSLRSLRRSTYSPRWMSATNDYVLRGPGRYLIWPRWRTEVRDLTLSEELSVRSKALEDWTDFANLLNSLSILVTLIVYASLYAAFVPHPIPFN